MCGSTSEYVEKRPGNFIGISASVKRQKKELGWQQRVDFAKWVRSYIDCFRGVLRKQT
jgi:dTDP-D-glucose 4,6-dehydratase